MDKAGSGTEKDSKANKVGNGDHADEGDKGGKADKAEKLANGGKGHKAGQKAAKAEKTQETPGGVNGVDKVGKPDKKARGETGESKAAGDMTGIDTHGDEKDHRETATELKPTPAEAARTTDLAADNSGEKNSGPTEDENRCTDGVEQKSKKSGGYRADAGGSLHIARNRMGKPKPKRVDVRDLFKDQE
jgi:hypothetical protein